MAHGMADEGNDPFLSASANSTHHRFSNFDTQLFAIGPATSPEQARRALEAHLAETERRIQDASKLGTTLVQQRQDLAERIKEVERHENEGSITPELRQKLVEIEREYNEVERASARAFLPKSRVSSSELGGSPFVSERSASPVKFESEAICSPTKMTIPNRKQRNQPSNRVHDIEFATEISTSLLSQVRHLQALLSEKEEALKNVSMEKSRLEVEAEGFAQRLRELDESEHRYKDENWNLETQIHEHLAQAKESADREKKLIQALNILQVEKNATEKELDEIKLSHAKLTEDHASALKHHDVELGMVKRSIVVAENERGALQRRVEELMGQNQELARAFAHQRGRPEDREPSRGLSDEDFETAPDHATPEHSPPPSPIKLTPRHSMLESETLKSSLLHAHRMIQNLKGNIHREKTEKLELKRMLQDARDELETKRTEVGSGARRSRKVESREFKKPLRPAQLGGARGSRSEIVLDDTNWEDEGQGSPSRSGSRGAVGAVVAAEMASHVTESSDQFDTANETSDNGGFETANEYRGTETEDFLTGVEDMSDSDELTETEGPGGTIRGKRPSILSLRKAGNRGSFQSTASNSDEYTYDDVRTPTSSQPQRLRLKVSRGGNRRSRMASEEPFQGSTANSSQNGTPQAAGKSLFAELGDLGGSDDDDESVTQDTPGHRSIKSKSATPVSRPSTAKTVIQSPPASPIVTFVSKSRMVDSGMMTEAWVPETATSESAVPLLAGLAGAGLAGATAAEAAHIIHDHHNHTNSEALPQVSEAAGKWHEDQLKSVLTVSPDSSTYTESSAQYEPGITKDLAKPSSPTTSRAQTALASATSPNGLESLTLSSIVSEHVEPQNPTVLEEQISPLSMSTIQVEHVVPKEAFVPEIIPQPLSMSTIYIEHLEPKEVVVPEVIAPPLSVSTIQAEHVEPREEPVPEIILPSLSMSSIYVEHIEPKKEPIPDVIPVPLTMSLIQSEHVEPKQELIPESTPVYLSMSPLQTEHVEPKSEPIVKTLAQDVIAPAPLSVSSIYMEHVEPKIEAAPKPAVMPLTMSNILVEHVEPVVVPDSPAREVIAPALPKPAPMSFSSIHSIEYEPVEPLTTLKPLRGGVMITRDGPEEEESPQKEQPETPNRSIISSVFGWKKDKSAPVPVIAEDETRQSPSQSALEDTTKSGRALRTLSSSATERISNTPQIATTDESSQTSLTAEEIESILKKNAAASVLLPEVSVHSPTEGAAFPQLALGVRKSQESVNGRNKNRINVDTELANESLQSKRSGSASSGRNGSLSGSHPPLPSDHKQAIAAAAQRTGSSNGGQGSMGPPLLPASAYKSTTSFRPGTPSSQNPTSPTRSGTTPRPVHSNSEVYSPPGTGNRSRNTSVSSFVSEIDARFNVRNGLQFPHGLEPGTDPRMINAITQTMIGEYLWKYTRRAGRGGMSENRHRRFFWVHPYTRTLYWSDRDPAQAGKVELKAKSVAIQAVRVVTDDNPMPPGLHRKSLIIMTPGRNVKFTAVTGQRHETWFNALSYLLLRTGEGSVEDTVEVANGLTRDDVAEFNPGYSNSSIRRGPPSLSTYNSRTTRNESPTRSTRVSLSDPPQLTPNGTQRPSAGTFSRLSSYLKPGEASKMGSTSSRRDRASFVGSKSSIYEASEVHDSAEDLREMIEKQDRDSDRLENVRACCDGKHDVGHLHQHHTATAKGRHSTTPGSVRAGATSRNQSRNSNR